MKIRVSSQGHAFDRPCPVEDCGGHLVERTNRSTGVKFFGCSNWSRTECPGALYDNDHSRDDDDYLDLCYFSAWRDWGDL